MKFGEFTLDSRARQLLRNAQPAHLSPKAFDFLALLTAFFPTLGKRMRFRKSAVVACVRAAHTGRAYTRDLRQKWLKGFMPSSAVLKATEGGCLRRKGELSSESTN